MKQCVFGLFFSLLFLNDIAGQAGQLVIKGYGKDLHLEHKVAAKEGIFAIGRLYNVHPKFIAAYNKIDMSKGLSIGQVLRIPLTDTNFSQKNTKGSPIYYVVGDKETLQKVSTVNKVPAQSLRDWNKLANDNLTTGKKLVIGYLVNEPMVATTPPPPKKESTAKELIDKQAKTEIDDKEAKATVKTESKKEEVKNTEPIVTKPPVTSDMSGQGYFKSSFDQQVRATPLSKTETVTSGIFKMVSGPSEAKYYLLADGISSGTVIRVINPDNNRTIYAKVLGAMDGNRTNKGLNIRISDSAASTLGIADTDKFIVKINY